MKRLIAALLAAGLAGASAVPGAAAAGRITIDVHDADVADVIRIIAVESGRNIIPDGSVRPQKVALRLRDMDPDDALSVFAHAYGLQVHREASVTIVGDAATMSRRYGYDGGNPGAAQTTVLQLLHSRPDEVAIALKGALPPSAVVVGDKRSNVVVVTADPATVERARRITLALDAPVYGAGSVGSESIALRYARASDLLKAVKGALPDNSAFADDTRNVIVLSGNAEARAQVRSLIAALDAPAGR